MNNSLSWSFYQAWNASLINRSNRELRERENIWAGELGGSFIDRYLKMTAVKPTNPPNPRSLRKFEAGNMMEWVVELVLRRAGILQSKQDWVSFQYPGLLQVTGKLDFLAGGSPDWQKAKEEVQSLGLPEFFGRATDSIIGNFQANFPTGLNQIVLECKSSATIPFETRERLGTPQPQHANQIFHYLKALNMREGHIVYICKDDLRMLEFGILNPGTQEDIYKKDIEQMTYYIKNKIRPEKELEVSFDADSCRFSKNWKVEYSSYLTLVYGYKQPEEYRERWDAKVKQFNSLLGRKAADKKMTDKNKEWEEECRAYFPNLDDYIGMVRAKLKKGEVTEELLESASV